MKTIKLNNGIEMPQMGYGVCKITNPRQARHSQGCQPMPIRAKM